MLVSDPTVLVIEDALDQAILVRVAARRAIPGLDVQVAGDGREGIAYLAGTPPFQDRQATDIDGFGVLGWLRERWGLGHVPVIVLTASEKPDDEGRSEDGSQDVFVHHSAIQAEGFKTLAEGAAVELEVVEGTKGPAAENVVQL